MWNVETISLAVAVVGGIVIPVFAFWRDIKTKFEKMNEKLAERLEHAVNKIVAKFDEHEKEDNRRFDQIKTDIWEIKLLNAAKDGVIMRKSDFDQKADTKTKS